MSSSTKGGIMAKPHYQFRIPEDLHGKVLAFRAETWKDQTEAMTVMIAAFFGQGSHVKFATPKKKIEWKPLSQFTKSRLAVYHCFGLFVGQKATSSDIATAIGGSTNNVSKRIGELASEGYVQPSGEYRRPCDSNKMLTLWRRTAKVYEVAK